MKRLIILCLLFQVCALSFAQTFVVDGIGYSITSDTTCGVYSCTTPNCNIPPTVNYNNADYTVNAIYGSVRISNTYSSNFYISFSGGLYGYHNNGYGHMYNNSIIQSITIPYTIEEISYNALCGLSNLSEVNWNARNAITTHNDGGYSTIFSYCNNLTNVTIGDSVQKIPNKFLSGLSNVTVVVFSDNVKEIGNQAFTGCMGLSSVSLPNNLQIIGDSAFYGCSGLFSVTLPDTLRVIEEMAFGNCSNLYSLNIGRNVETFGDRAFKSCTMLNNVIYNPHNASYLSSSYLFAGSNNVANIIIGDDVESIPPNFMNAKQNLHNIVLPEGLILIGNNAFYDCGLEELVIPSTVTHIGQNAFYNNTSLSRLISLPDNPPVIYQSSFSGISNGAEIIVPCNTSAEYQIHPWWNGMINIKETCRYSSMNDTICNGEVYEYGNQYANVSGTYSDTIHIDPYVDSIITIQLVVNPTYDITLSEQICNEQSYTSNGFNENESGTYILELTNIYGCDSIVRLNLTVNPTFDTSITASICQGDTYSQYGFNTSVEGNYSQSLSSFSGCDSIVHLQLTVNPIYSEHLSEIITDVQNYQFLDSTLTQSGVYQRTAQTLAGCDSILILTLTVIPSVDTVIVHDTVLYPEYITVIDSLYLHDTIIVYDTTFIVDTLIVYVDTLVIHDTIYIHDTIITGIGDVAVFNAKIYANNGELVVEGGFGEDVMLYDLTGRLVAIRRKCSSNIERFPVSSSGSYLVKIGNHPAKKVVVIK